MPRMITDPENYSIKDLQNYDWDVVKLNITFDQEKFLNWYKEINEKYSEYMFLPQKKEMLKYIDPKYKDWVTNITENTTWGTMRQWTLQWFFQKKGLIPFTIAADRTIYPEVDDPDWLNGQSRVHLEQYYFGFYKKIIEELGDNIFNVSRLVVFEKNSGLNTHVDNGPRESEPFLIRLHFQIQVDENAIWHFGEGLLDHDDPLSSLTERTYKMEPGCVYIYNTAIPHAAFNWSENQWIMMHCNPTDDAIDRLLKTKLHLS